MTDDDTTLSEKLLMAADRAATVDGWEWLCSIGDTVGHGTASHLELTDKVLLADVMAYRYGRKRLVDAILEAAARAMEQGQ